MTLADAAVNKIDGLINEVTAGFAPYLEKMQKGKDDAWRLTYDEVFVNPPQLEGTSPPTPPAEPTDDTPALPDDCVMWSGPNYTGTRHTVVHTKKDENGWETHVVPEMTLGSFKCGADTRIWFHDEPVVGTGNGNPAQPISGSKGWVENPNGPGLKFH